MQASDRHFILTSTVEQIAAFYTGKELRALGAELDLKFLGDARMKTYKYSWAYQLQARLQATATPEPSPEPTTEFVPESGKETIKKVVAHFYGDNDKFNKAMVEKIYTASNKPAIERDFSDNVLVKDFLNKAVQMMNKAA